MEKVELDTAELVELVRINASLLLPSWSRKPGYENLTERIILNQIEYSGDTRDSPQDHPCMEIEIYFIKIGLSQFDNGSSSTRPISRSFFSPSLHPVSRARYASSKPGETGFPLARSVSKTQSDLSCSSHRLLRECRRGRRAAQPQLQMDISPRAS